MGDHFALLVDRLLTDSTLEANIKGPKLARNLPDSASLVVPISEFSLKKKKGVKLVECRICQEEDEASNMETPCSCCGSLKVNSMSSYNFWKLIFVVFMFLFTCLVVISEHIGFYMFDVVEVVECFCYNGYSLLQLSGPEQGFKYRLILIYVS